MMAAKLGSGARYSALRAALAAQGVRDPSALAASLGRKKYGKGRMQRMAQAGRKRAAGQ